MMPKKNGQEAYEEIRRLKPGIRALFTSGYTPEVVLKKGILLEGANFVMKPISPEVLLKKVREVLDK
jgi:DNA-binding NarL/FixJ family response regulator